jgi:4-amino-4-deoxy-L-arabinose transferase-like glycosyltransferase
MTTTPLSNGSDGRTVPHASPFWRQPVFATHCLILGFALLHVGIATVLPLVTFETHYALYGVHLDWSYIDHPPMVGWIQALVQLYSHTDFAMRIAPIVLTTASQYLLVSLVLRLFPGESPWLGFVTVLLLQGAMIMHGSIAMAPEVPLLLFGVMVAWFTQRVLATPSKANWLGVGIALGLCGLSKYTAVTLAISLVLVLLLCRGPRAFLQSGFWLAVGVAGLLVSPVLIWNWQHEWASFTYQIGYQMEEQGGPWSWRDALDMQLQQFVAFSPALYVAGLAAIGTRWGRRETGSRLLLCFALPILLVFTYTSGAGRTSVHWFLLGWVFLAPLAARWIMAHWNSRATRIGVKASAGLSILLLLVALLLPLPGLPFPDYGHPLSRVLGWQDASMRAEALRRQWWAEDDGGEMPIILVDNWHYGGPLAWYGHPTAVKYLGNKDNQYRIWYGTIEPDTRGILVLFDERNRVPRVNEPGYDCQQVDTLPAYRGTVITRMFYFYRCAPVTEP